MERNQRIRLYSAAWLAFAAGGCVTDGGSLMILQNQVPGDDCVISPSEDAPFRSRGIIDVQASIGYVFTPVVRSLIDEARSDGASQGIVTVEGADVEVRFPGGFFSAGEEGELRDDALNRFSQAFSGSVAPGGTTSFAFVIVPAGLLDRVGAKLGTGEAVQAIAEVSVFGFVDDIDVDSTPFRYPIDVCKGCLKSNLGDCAELPEGFEPDVGGECNDLQDAALDCCNAGGVEICPAVAPST